VIKFKGGHSEKIPTPTIDKEPKFLKPAFFLTQKSTFKITNKVRRVKNA